MNIYSPEQPINLSQTESFQGEFYVKRDDLIHPFVSGNKWRKLKHYLQLAKERNLHHLITFGGPWSNHLLATACAGAIHSLKTTGVVRGEPVNNPVLTMCQLYGMRLRFISRGEYREKEAYFENNFNPDEALFINEGGSGEEGLVGCKEIINELNQPYDHIICAAGTGTTAAGILSQLIATKQDTQLHVIPVLKGKGYMEGEIRRLLKVDSKQLKIHEEYHFGGYAKSTKELLDFIASFCRQTGILIEPVYTGKAFYAAVDLMNKGAFSPKSKVLLLHTGGLTGILGKCQDFTF